ncbi:MAG: hypothetical protein E6K54_03590 [Gammaproteobacteria bacterium]|nr:MAG: hypothetical protein E6K54_03590 [Gammaproteobacteria bacterium]
MKITILGGGFGLYGYLPALCNLDNLNIILPQRYQQHFLQRDDIKSFYDQVEWVKKDEELLEICEGVIIALPPRQQTICVKKCLGYKHISHFLLEKPVAITPHLAIDLITNLKKSGKKFRIAYNFRYTEWGETLLASLGGIKNIAWNFQAHHYAKNIQTWKRLHQEGGGALRFYGIHLIALLTELGYDTVSYSEININQSNEAENWEAEIAGVNLVTCSVKLATDSRDTNFLVKDNKNHTYSFLHPFDTASTGIASFSDDRIPFLTKLLQDLFYGEKQYYEWYETTNLLWNRIEQKVL